MRRSKERREGGGRDARSSELDVRPPDDSRVSLVGLVERLERQGRAVKLDDVVAGFVKISSSAFVRDLSHRQEGR